MIVDLIFEEELYFISRPDILLRDFIKKNRIVSEKYVIYIINENEILMEFSSYHNTIFIAEYIKTKFLIKMNKSDLYNELRRVYHTYYSMDNMSIHISNRFWTQYQTESILQRHRLENVHNGE